MKHKKHIALLICLTLLFLTLGACAPKAPNPTEEKTDVSETAAFTFTKENYPRMGGSLANLPLGQAVTATVLGVSREEANDLITFAGSTTDNYKAIVDGDFDILLAYEPSEEAKAYVENSGEELEMVPIGVDALVFICAKENPVTDLTLSEIKSVYAGETTNWQTLGGNDGDIIAYQRNPESGSQTLFDKLIDLGDDLMEPPVGQRVGTMLGLLEAVADYDNSENALGYTVYYYLTNMETEKLSRAKLLSVDGVEPTNETIGSGAYPLTNDFYVVIRKSAEIHSPERILFNWICSAQGQELVKQENYPVR